MKELLAADDEQVVTELLQKNAALSCYKPGKELIIG
jgi:hypothetical protein